MRPDALLRQIGGSHVIALAPALSALLFVAACGRLGFDPQTGDDSPDGPGGPDGALLAGALAAVSPNPGHAVQPPPRAQGATASRQDAAMLAPAAARTWHLPGKAAAGALPQPGLPTCPPSGRPASAASTLMPSDGQQAPGKPAQRTTAHRQHRTLPPDPAPHAT